MLLFFNCMLAPELVQFVNLKVPFGLFTTVPELGLGTKSAVPKSARRGEQRGNEAAAVQRRAGWPPWMQLAVRRRLR